MEEQPRPTKQERRLLKKQEKIKEAQRRVRKRLRKKIISWSLVVVIGAGAVFGIIKLASAPNNSASLTASIADTDWVKGNQESTVYLVEYSDFQCPACGSYYSVLKELTQEFESEIAFVYRHFPLRQIHPNANIAAQAAEAAGLQGKFWEMHDMLFDNQKAWSGQKKVEETFLTYAEELGLDTLQFESDLNSKQVKNKVDNDYKSGLALRVNSTPSFFLNGKKIQSPRTLEEFKSLIQEALPSE